MPPMFDGNRLTGQGFYNDCRSYICFHPETFEDDPAKIRFVMSHMVAGHADHWANRELGVERNGALRFVNWADFAAEFRRLFMSSDVEDHAAGVLETDYYFQGNQTVSDYLEHFRDLIDDAGITDPRYIVIKFRRGLNHQALSAISNLVKPPLGNPEAWFSLALDACRSNRPTEHCTRSTLACPKTSTSEVSNSEPSKNPGTSTHSEVSSDPGNKSKGLTEVPRDSKPIRNVENVTPFVPPSLSTLSREYLHVPVPTDFGTPRTYSEDFRSYSNVLQACSDLSHDLLAVARVVIPRMSIATDYCTPGTTENCAEDIACFDTQSKEPLRDEPISGVAPVVGMPSSTDVPSTLFNPSPTVQKSSGTPSPLRNNWSSVPQRDVGKDISKRRRFVPNEQWKFRHPRWARRLRPRKPGTDTTPALVSI